MWNPRHIYLFNCDRTYKLDAVEDWLNGTKLKLGFEFSVEKHYFSLSEMSEWSSKKIPGLQMDFAVFVVHAHESRLSINEDNAGIGYAKIYKALLQATGENVIIVIGGDDNYENEDEEDREFISRWAKRKVSSQFSEEFQDGRKSFIFSWNKKHREIHEEALVHFFDSSKKGQKFEYQPKPKFPLASVTPPPSRAAEPARRKPEETRPTPRPGLFDENKKEYGYLSSPRAKSQQTPRAAETTGRIPEEPGARDPLLCADDRLEVKKMEDSCPSASYSKGTGGNAPANTERADRSGHHTFERKEQKDLSVLGWEAKYESLKAVTQLIEKHRDQLDLASDLDVYNATVHDMISYLENNPLKYCVLVVDAEKVKVAHHLESGDDYLKLLRTAERHVEKKIIVIVCRPPSLSIEEKTDVKRTLQKAFSDSGKFFVAWFEELGQKVDELIEFLTSSNASTSPYPQQQRDVAKFLAFETREPRAQENASSSTSQGLYYDPAFAYSTQPHAHLAETDPLHPVTGPYMRKRVLPPNKIIMVQTHLRNGRISNQPDDTEYWKPGFVIPNNMKLDLSRRYSKKSDAYLLIFKEENGRLTCQATVKKGKEWQQIQELHPDETINLQTRLKRGQISFEPKDVVHHLADFRVPPVLVSKLRDEFRATPNAELVIVSDSDKKYRIIVRDEKVNRVIRFFNEHVAKLGT